MALVVPVVAFILAAVFMAVYWPLSVQPDGGLAVMQGAGWVPVLVTLLYSIIWLQVRFMGSATGKMAAFMLSACMHLSPWQQEAEAHSCGTCQLRHGTFLMQIADVAKVVVQRLFRRYEITKVRRVLSVTATCCSVWRCCSVAGHCRCRPCCLQQFE